MRRRATGFTLVEAAITLTVLAVLLAMAYTAYQDRKRGAYLAEALGFAENAKTAMENHYVRHLAWPTNNAQLGLPPATAFRSEAIKSFTVAASAGKGVIIVTFNDRVLDSAEVAVMAEASSDGSVAWHCRADSTIMRLMPANC